MNIAEIGREFEGRVVDARLTLRQWLGSSGHSSVYLTELAGPGSPKAVVKIFPVEFFDVDHQLARWRAAAQLNNPALLRLLDGGRTEIDGTPFFFVVTDFAEEDLSQILPQRALTPEEVTALLPPVLEGLNYLHMHGFVHGHIQPSNIMASGDKLKLPVERIYAMGELRDNTTELTAYDAPEIAMGPMTPAADVWSLGMFLVAALKQQPLPLQSNPKIPLVIPADIPEPLRTIIGDCLALDSKSRCTISEIGAWLHPEPASKSSSAPTPVAAQPVNPKAAKPSPVRIVEVPADTSTSPSRSTGFNWRVGAPIAAIALIGALVLGQKLLSPKTQPPATTAPAVIAPAAPVPAANTANTVPDDGVVRRIVPEVSARSRRTIHGEIRIGVQVEVDASGKVTAARAVSAGPSKFLENLALRNAQQWEFAPAQQNGAAVPSEWLLRYQFSRRSTQVVPLRVSQP